jgi:hypothetical protein
LVRNAAVTRDDLVLTDAERAQLLCGAVIVEEKLDGANVMIWLDAGGMLAAATRGGAGAMDRGGQLGPLRAWMGPRSDQLRTLLRGGRVLYGEWLWRRHSVRYARLRDWFIGLDVLERTGGWLDVEARDRALGTAGIERPPRIAGPSMWDLQRLGRLAAPSSLGDEPAEGIIVRRAPGVAGSIRLAKLVFPTFRRVSDEAWAEARAGNRVA